MSCFPDPGPCPVCDAPHTSCNGVIVAPVPVAPVPAGVFTTATYRRWPRVRA